MKKCLIILLAAVVLATSSPAYQIVEVTVKAAAFFHHYIHHAAGHQDNIGMLGFIRLHYFDHEHKDSNHTGHENLPFQHRDDHTIIVLQAPFALPESCMVAAFPKLEISSNPLIDCPQQWLSSLHVGEIWQPPKA